MAHLIFRLMFAYEKSVAISSALNGVEVFLLQSVNHNVILIQTDTKIYQRGETGGCSIVHKNAFRQKDS